jgi:hypothetical protein
MPLKETVSPLLTGFGAVKRGRSPSAPSQWFELALQTLLM